MSKNYISFLTSYFLNIPAIPAQSQTTVWLKKRSASRLRTGGEEKEEDDYDMEVSDKDVDRMNDYEEEDRTNN